MMHKLVLLLVLAIAGHANANLEFLERGKGGKMQNCEIYLKNTCEKSTKDFVQMVLDNPGTCIKRSCIFTPKIGTTENPHHPYVSYRPKQYTRKILYSLSSGDLKAEVCAIQHQPCSCSNAQKCKCNSETARFCTQQWRVAKKHFIVMKTPQYGAGNGPHYAIGRSGETSDDSGPSPRHFSTGDHGSMGDMYSNQDPASLFKMMQYKQTMGQQYPGSGIQSYPTGMDPKQLLYLQYLKSMSGQGSDKDDKSDKSSYLKWLYMFQLMKKYQQPQGSYQQPQGAYQQPQGAYQQPQGDQYHSGQHSSGHSHHNGGQQAPQDGQQGGTIYQYNPSKGGQDYQQGHYHSTGHQEQSNHAHPSHQSTNSHSPNMLQLYLLLSKGSSGGSDVLKGMLPYLIGSGNKHGGLISVESLYIMVPNGCKCPERPKPTPKPKPSLPPFNFPSFPWPMKPQLPPYHQFQGFPPYVPSLPKYEQYVPDNKPSQPPFNFPFYPMGNGGSQFPMGNGGSQFPMGNGGSQFPDFYKYLFQRQSSKSSEPKKGGSKPKKP